MVRFERWLWFRRGRKDALRGRHDPAAWRWRDGYMDGWMSVSEHL